MTIEKQRWQSKQIVDYLKEHWFTWSYSEREKLFYSLFESREKYRWTREQNVKLLSRIKRENLSREVNKKTENIEKIPVWIEQVLSNAKKYKWNPFDTSEKWVDWASYYKWKKTWKCNLKDNFTWEVYSSLERPFVCADLVITSLQESWLIELPNIRNPYFWRRVWNIEKLAKSNPKLFKVFIKNSKDWNIDGCIKWDIITFTSKNWMRHCWFVTEVDNKWKPIKILNARFDWVVEIPFISTKSIWKDYKWWDRHDWFFTTNEWKTLNQIIRPIPWTTMLAQIQEPKSRKTKSRKERRPKTENS